MKRKELLLIIILIIGILSTITLISSNTKALPISSEIDFTKKITYYEDEDLLVQNIKEFIAQNDDILIALSSYEDGEVLSDNYDYMTNIAINYISDNKDNYQDKIEDNMIDIKYIYEITYNFFGKNNYYIKDQIDNKISLIKINKRFKMNLDSIKIKIIKNNNIEAYTRYILGKETMNYKYIFKIENNEIYLENIEVDYEEN
jgi:hypothetical protein